MLRLPIEPRTCIASRQVSQAIWTYQPVVRHLAPETCCTSALEFVHNANLEMSSFFFLRRPVLINALHVCCASWSAWSTPVAILAALSCWAGEAWRDYMCQESLSQIQSNPASSHALRAKTEWLVALWLCDNGHSGLISSHLLAPHY